MEGSGAGGSAWCSVLEEERTGAGKNPRRKSATPSTSITTQQAAKVPEPSRIVPTRRARTRSPPHPSQLRAPSRVSLGTGCFREQPLNKLELARVTGGDSCRHHVRRRARNMQNRRTLPGAGNPRVLLRVLPARALAPSLPPARPRPRFPDGGVGCVSRGLENLTCAIPPAGSFRMCHLSLLSLVPSLSEPSPFLGRSEQRAPSLSWASSWAAVTSLSDLEKVKLTSGTRVSLCELHSKTLLRRRSRPLTGRCLCPRLPCVLGTGSS